MIHTQKKLHTILEQAAQIFGGRVIGQPKFGWHQKSAGCRLQLKTKIVWLKVTSFKTSTLAKSFIEKMKSVNVLEKINAPRYLRVSQWESEGLYWTAITLTFIPQPSFSFTPLLLSKPKMNKAWLNSLKRQLKILSKIPTTYLNCRQDLITRRIRERFGPMINTTITHWATIHGDLHWANLTEKEPWILDWEGYGIGPRVLDLCFLYCYSLLEKDAAEVLWTSFKDEYESADGRICLLYVAAELMRMYEIYGDYEELYRPLKAFAQSLLLCPITQNH